MTDLEELAIRRDRGYLVRLVLVLLLGIGACVFIMQWLTGSHTVGCVASAFLGQESVGKPAPAAVEPAKAP